MKNKKWYLIIVIALLFLVGCSKAQETVNDGQKNAEPATNSETQQKSVTPTLFIHGYSGGKSSFGGMIKRLEKDNYTKKELTLTVDASGEIQAKGKLTGQANNPSVQVLFEENKSHEWNQAEWIKNCLLYVRDTYNIHEVNVVGHSMGGASSFRFLTTFGDDSTLPKIKKFVAIAAPFNNFVEDSSVENIETVLADGPKIQSERYTDYVNGIEKVPSDMKTLLIAGDVEDGSSGDEAVAVTDALSVVSLLRLHGNDVQEKIFYGKTAQHSKLHENVEVDQTVANFLWNE
ncbi:alpha/beta fold hydrolase [Enterococcus rivorum]|uniref:Alpha/beta hydrolase n=1 Tax=Enterococcus rivorum TaxID=762845 RepID=A0A1E5L155_9ENTE|nr:alpha/beta fold hydrolase [Enterococcus rivorum]MBP2098568.1 putative alpha/beta hydrolase family protein [Enterococcus rivorum]OEH83846.1 hypothetical protein BCR26_07550 [Enterococcus rivorum]